MTRTVIRLATVAFCATTAAYAFLAASPFTFQEMIRPGMFGLGAFSRWHTALYWAWLAVALFDVRGHLRASGFSGRLARGFAFTWTVIGLVIATHAVLPGLVDDEWSLAVGVVALLPMVWLAAIDHVTAREVLTRTVALDADCRAANEGRWLAAALGSAAFIALLYGALTPVFMRGRFEPDLLTLGLATGLAWNAVEHAFVFSAAFLVLAVTMRLVARAPFAAQYAALGAVLTATVSLIVQRLACDALGFEGWRSGVAAVASGAAIVATWAGLRLRRRTETGAGILTPVDVFFKPAPLRGQRLDGRQVLPFLIIVAAAWGIAAASRVIDWDFLLLKTGVVVLWFAVADQVLGVMPLVRLSDTSLALACVVPLMLHASGGAVEGYAPIVTRDAQFSVRRVLDRYLIYNASFRVADGALRPSLASGRTGQAAFLRFLRENTGLGRSDIPPVNLELTSPLREARHPPHVFLFVIDSLRRDYLSPYNPSVTFTPNLAAFATDSYAFRNAFTLYGGTGLSVPAIWMGGVGVHKQYVRPFWPMNTLEKLLSANRYRRVMSVDVIMEQLLKPADSTIELDRGVRTMDYRLCATLDELQAASALSEDDDGPPIFGYSLPQDLHVSNIMTASVPPGESYPGFHAPYAARVHAMDRCFGAFVDFLKRHRLYDDSMIVLTADHGEMLGEEGRWGHAYYLFPQILEVPLIVHFPASAAMAPPPDLDAIAFLTDISPTIYTALGYRTHAPNALMGEPLVGPDRADPQLRRSGDYVAAASYSAVYAVVRRNGRRLYIVDAMKGEDYAYDKTPDGRWLRKPVAEGFRTTAQRLIRERIDEIRRVYHVTGGI